MHVHAGCGGGEGTLRLSSEPADSVLGLAPREGRGTARQRGTGSHAGPAASASASGRCGSATVWPRGVRAPPLPRLLRAAPQPRPTPAASEAGRGRGPVARTPPSPPFSCPSPLLELFAPLAAQGTEQGVAAPGDVVRGQGRQMVAPVWRPGLPSAPGTPAPGGAPGQLSRL